MFLGVDFSLTATGVSIFEENEFEVATVRSKPEAKWHGFPARCKGIARDVYRFVDSEPFSDAVRLWAIETPSFGSRGQLDRLYAGWWIVVEALATEIGHYPVRVTPSQLKKFATGKGNASKDTVLLSVERRYPEARVGNNNEADAVVLSAIAAALAGQPIGAITKAQGEVLKVLRQGLRPA